MPKEKSTCLTIDVFCQVIDHFGDAGTAWRLCRELQELAGKSITLRLFIDDLKPLASLVIQPSIPDAIQVIDGIEVIPWQAISVWGKSGAHPAEVMIEMFGCDPPPCYMAKVPLFTRLILNLEYFSCEAWATDFHLRESLLDFSGPRKFFFMPGLDVHSGGIMSSSRPSYPTDKLQLSARQAWLGQNGGQLEWAQRRWLPIYTYGQDLDSLLKTLAHDEQKTLVLVMGQASQDALRSNILGNGNDLKSPFTVSDLGQCTVWFCPFFSQVSFDALLALADFSLVRGEDSLAGALLSGRPFLWQLYPQAQNHQLVKLEAFLAYLQTAWSDEALARLYNQAAKNFNISTESVWVPWAEIMAAIPDMTSDFSLVSASLRESCNLTRKVLEFSTHFSKGV